MTQDLNNHAGSADHTALHCSPLKLDEPPSSVQLFADAGETPDQKSFHARPPKQILFAGDLIVRVLSVDGVPEAATLFKDFLDAAEIRRTAAFRRPVDSQAYAAAHALLRITLSDLLHDEAGSRAPADWLFETQAYGKPRLAPGQVAMDLRFNMSHTKGMVVVAFAIGRDVGIDIEAIDRHTVDDGGIAGTYFSTSEQAYLHSFTEPAQRKLAFLELWTAKEAFIKAIGQGLSMPLDSFSADLRRDCYLPQSLPPEAQDRRWELKRWRTAHHLVALATGSAPQLRAPDVDFREVFWCPHKRNFDLRS